MRRELAYLSVYCWQGFGGEHYWGEVHYEDINKEKWEVKHPMSAKEAKNLNKKDGTSKWARYKPGDLTERFETKEGVIAFTVKEFKKLHPDGILIQGSHCSCSPHPIVFAPKQFKDKVVEMNKIALEFDSLYDHLGRQKDWQKAAKLEREWVGMLRTIHVIE